MISTPELDRLRSLENLARSQESVVQNKSVKSACRRIADKIEIEYLKLKSAHAKAIQFNGK